VKADPRALLIPLLALAGAACSHQVQEVDDSDPAVKARVEASLRGSKDVDIRYVTVDVERGLVTISGLVNSIEQAQAIGNIIKRVHGVDAVLNNLAVQE
jgi:osmotically-inducible protein OsmY